MIITRASMLMGKVEALEATTSMELNLKTMNEVLCYTDTQDLPGMSDPSMCSKEYTVLVFCHQHLLIGLSKNHMIL